MILSSRKRQPRWCDKMIPENDRETEYLIVLTKTEWDHLFTPAGATLSRPVASARCDGWLTVRFKPRSKTK